MVFKKIGRDFPGGPVAEITQLAISSGGPGSVQHAATKNQGNHIKKEIHIF